MSRFLHLYSMRNGIFGTLCCILFMACQNKVQVKNDIPVIDGMTQKKATVSELFPEIGVVPLQTSDSSLIGIWVKDLKRSGNRLFLLNQMSSRVNLLCFDTTGQFIHAIDRIGHGPQEYTYLGDFVAAPDSNAWVLMVGQGKYMIFDTDGNYLSTIQQQQPYYYNRQVVRTDDSTCIVFHDGTFPENSDLLEVDARTFAIRRSASASDPLASEGTRPLSLWGGRVLYYQMNDTIYDATDIQNRKPLYYLDFGDGQREAEKEARRILSESGDREQMLKQLGETFLKGEYMLVARLFENARWIAVSGMRQNPDIDVKNDFRSSSFFMLYDKESGQSYHSDYITWDILNTGPLDDIALVGCDELGTLYAIWYGTPSEKDKQRIARSDKLPQEVKNRLLQLEEGDNPVLFMLR